MFFISCIRPNIKFGTLIPLQPQVLGSTAAAAFAKEKTDNSCSGEYKPFKLLHIANLLLR